MKPSDKLASEVIDAAILYRKICLFIGCVAAVFILIFAAVFVTNLILSHLSQAAVIAGATALIVGHAVWNWDGK